jgi:hypothetical protein
MNILLPPEKPKTFLGGLFKGSQVHHGRALLQPGEASAASHCGPSIAEATTLHGLAFPTIRDRVETEVPADSVHFHEIIFGIGHNPAASIKLADLPFIDLIDFLSGNPKILPRLGDGRNPMADQIIAFVYFSNDVLRI